MSFHLEHIFELFTIPTDHFSSIPLTTYIHIICYSGLASLVNKIDDKKMPDVPITINCLRKLF